MLNRIRAIHSPVRPLLTSNDGRGLNHLQLPDFRQYRVPCHHRQIVSSETRVLVRRRAVEGVLDELRTQGREHEETLCFCWFRQVYSSPFERRIHSQLASLDTFMSKTARLYQDTRNVAGGSNLDKLNDELQDVTRIMTKNMEELLWRGDSLDRKFTPASCVSRHLILSLQGCRTCRRHYDPSLKSTAKRRVTSTSRL